MSSIGPVVSEEKMFENVDGRQTTDAGVTGILLAHQWAFGSGELKSWNKTILYNTSFRTFLNKLIHDFIEFQKLSLSRVFCWPKCPESLEFWQKYSTLECRSGGTTRHFDMVSDRSLV